MKSWPVEITRSMAVRLIGSEASQAANPGRRLARNVKSAGRSFVARHSLNSWGSIFHSVPAGGWVYVEIVMHPARDRGPIEPGEYMPIVTKLACQLFEGHRISDVLCYGLRELE